jgi:predicted amidohydrolase
MKPWRALCLQTRTPVLGEAEVTTAREILRERFQQYAAMLAQSADGCDLVLFPEYMCGPAGPKLAGVLDFPGPELEFLQTLAQKHRIFLGGHAYTRDGRFPGRYFNTSFLLDRSGNLILKFYRIHTYHSHSPHDFWDAYIDAVGVEGAFPVADTELGKLSMLASMEFMFPEIARMFVLRGAEVLLHDTSEQIVDESVKRCRALENMAFVISTNVPLVGAGNLRVGSRIIGWNSDVLASVEDGTEGHCTAAIDLDSLRVRRADPDLSMPVSRGLNNVNYLSRLRVEIVRPVYDKVSIYPPGTYRGGEIKQEAVTPLTNAANLRTGLRQMYAAGMLSSDPDTSGR